MGLFDDIKIERAMPDGYRAKGDQYQTKDFDCQMDAYRITDDGRLERAIYETTPEAELPHPKMPVIGSIRRTGAWEVVNFHGIINFYDWDEKVEPKWHSYLAKFTDGELIEIAVGESDD